MSDQPRTMQRDPAEAAIRAAEHRLHFIETELEVAFIFLAAAKTTQLTHIRERNIRAARTARDEVKHLLAQGYAERQRTSIESSLAMLETRLIEQGSLS
jgi:hypothetical protein